MRRQHGQGLGDNPLALRLRSRSSHKTLARIDPCSTSLPRLYIANWEASLRVSLSKDEKRLIITGVLLLAIHNAFWESFAESLKRCNSVSEDDEEESTSPKRIALSPDLHVKAEPREHAEKDHHGSSPEVRKSPEHSVDNILNTNNKYLLENLHDRSQEFRYPRLSKEISALSLRHPPMELLGKLFPHHSKGTLELILQSCNGSVVESIELLLSSQDQRGNKMALGGCGFPPTNHSSPFLHGPMTRNVITRPLPSTHPCSPSGIYPPSPLPPPLLVKPKPELALKFSPLPHAPYGAEPRLGERPCGLGMSRFCSRCGYKINMFDKFCAHCGKVLSETPTGL